MQAFNRGEFQLSPDQARVRCEHQAAARATLSNLRIAEAPPLNAGNSFSASQSNTKVRNSN